jgi:uncharacterized protein YifE (UPF0438 family)
MVLNSKLFDHWRLVAQRDYRIPRGSDLSELTVSELELIRRYGSWMEALELGILSPMTRAQEQFLRMCRGKQAPAAKFAVAWMKLKRAGAASGRVSAAPERRRTAAGFNRTWTVCPRCTDRGNRNPVCPKCAGSGWLEESSRTARWRQAAADDRRRSA